ncbi:MAG: mechanosensitive ion channel family protein [Candidatus Paracaedibacteraceae bacterium]|nr:mechanosensitive ion channel family protein [Candidatus Paracaedibacteraceae bacterium]
MKNSKYQININSILYAVIKIILMAMCSYIVAGHWHSELHQPIKWGESRIIPMNLLVLYACIFTTMQITKILRNCLWEYYLPKKRNIKMSTLLIGLINFGIYLLCTFVACRFVLGLEVGSALTATGAVGVVLGFGLQKMFLDLFVGISIDMDKSFRMGDWVFLRSNNMDIYGEIIQMSWRVVTIQTTENVTHQIPNNIFGMQIITNLSRPSAESEFELMYCIPFEYNENAVIRAITLGLEAVGCTGVITDYKCRVSKVSTEGVYYKVKYFLNPAKCGPGKVRHLIHSRVFRFLRAANIKLATQMQRVYITEIADQIFTPTEETANYIAQIDIFQTLTERQVKEIATVSRKRNFNKGDVICSQGEEGRSLFIVCEGMLKVFITNEAGAQQQVAVLIPEDFFGEMSLLTGDRRSATVIAESQITLLEIESDALIPLFANDEKFPQIVSKIITERNATNTALGRTHEEEVEQVSKLRELEMRIKNFSKKLLGIKN